MDRDRGGKRFGGIPTPALSVWPLLILLLIASTALGASPRNLPGWPRILGNGIHGSPAVADLDGDGRDEIAVGLRDGRVLLLDGHGHLLSGWPRRASHAVYASPVFVDLDGDGALELAAYANDGRCYAWRSGGDLLPGWPVVLGGLPANPPRALRVAGRAALALYSITGELRLLDGHGDTLPGWPRRMPSSSSTRYDRNALELADLDGDGRTEILAIAKENAALRIWSAAGEPLLSLDLGGKGVGLSVLSTPEGPRLLCTTSERLLLLDADGESLLEWRSDLPGEEFTVAATALTLEPGAPPEIFAVTDRGGVHRWDLAGASRPGWPLHLGGFIYGLGGAEAEIFSIQASPVPVDLDGDGRLEILVGSRDQHLYAFDAEGRSMPGWPRIVDDGIQARPVLAQLDGRGPAEVLVGQTGESLFAFQLDPGAQATRGGFVVPEDLAPVGEWPPHHGLVAGLLVLLLATSLAVLRHPLSVCRRMPRSRLLGSALLLLLLLRALLFAGELAAYRASEKALTAASRQAVAITATFQDDLERRAALIAAELSAARGLDGGDPLRMLYHLEALAGRHRLDFEEAGLAVVDTEGRVLQSLGLAQELTDDPGPGPLLVGDRPALQGRAMLKSERREFRLLLIADLAAHLPQALAESTGASVTLKRDGLSVAWSGTGDSPPAGAWLGTVRPARELGLDESGDRARLSLRLADDRYSLAAGGWPDLLLVVFLALTALILPATDRDRRPRVAVALPWFLLLLTAVVLLTRGELIRRPTPMVGHLLEVGLMFAGLLGAVILLRVLARSHHLRRLRIALIGSYLLVGFLPLVLVFLIAAGLLRQAQATSLRTALDDSGASTDHLLLAYFGTTGFPNRLSSALDRLRDEQTEHRWYNFVADDQLLFTYEHPAAYITLCAWDAVDPDRTYSGYSYRAPRREKFATSLPAWLGDGRPGALYSRGGRAFLRAGRTLRHRGVVGQLAATLPLDRTALAELEERLRILPFLPPVHLQPAWSATGAVPVRPPGWYLPFSSRFDLPARDWETGAPRVLSVRARAFLPAGSEMWRVSLFLLLLAALPMGLAVWGGWYSLRRTAGPMSRLLTGIRRVETGDLDYRLGAGGRSEVAEAARAFDRMADSLQATVLELAEKRKAAELSALKSRFISMVSHDLKTPLAAIEGAADNVLAEVAGPVSDPQRRYLEMIRNSSGRLSGMIGDLLDLSRIESGRLILEPELLDLRLETENVLAGMRPLLEERGLETTLEAPEAGPHLRADRHRLWQVTSNLLGNALRFSPDGGRIDVVIAEEPGRVSVTINDQGPGIPVAEREGVFEPFTTGGEGRTGGGTGLGLTIVKQLVTLHGGEVTLSDAPGGGARFRFTLPLDPISQEETS